MVLNLPDAETFNTVSHAVLTPPTALLYCCIIAVILLVMNRNVISDVQAINK